MLPNNQAAVLMRLYRFRPTNTSLSPICLSFPSLVLFWLMISSSKKNILYAVAPQSNHSHHSFTHLHFINHAYLCLSHTRLCGSALFYPNNRFQSLYKPYRHSFKPLAHETCATVLHFFVINSSSPPQYWRLGCLWQSVFVYMCITLDNDHFDSTVQARYSCLSMYTMTITNYF